MDEHLICESPKHFSRDNVFTKNTLNENIVK